MIQFNERYTGASGLLGTFFNPLDPRPAKEQFHEAYDHGGGWRAFSGFDLVFDEAPEDAYLTYPGDRPLRAMAYAQLRDELLILFEGSWLCIRQPDGAYEIARAD